MSRVRLGQPISTKDLVENNPLVQTQGSSLDPRSCSKDQTLNSRNSEFNVIDTLEEEVWKGVCSAPGDCEKISRGRDG